MPFREGQSFTGADPAEVVEYLRGRSVSSFFKDDVRVCPTMLAHSGKNSEARDFRAQAVLCARDWELFTEARMKSTVCSFLCESVDFL